MEALAKEAAKTIEQYRSNKVIMDFVEKEARTKVAEEMKGRIGSSGTYKAVEILERRYPNIKARVDDYVSLGLIACYFKSIEMAA